MDILPVVVCLYAALLMVSWVKSEPSCDQTEFLHSNGTCVPCPVCVAGEQLSEDCGFGDGGEGICILCEEGKFSTETGVAPCRRCTQCRLLNRLEEAACSSTTDALCGRCLPGYYELRSMTGEAELLCVPCYSHDTVHKECLQLTPQSSKTLQKETFSVVLIGSATAMLIFTIALLLWVFLLTAERFKAVPECCPEPKGLLSAADLQYTPLCSHTERETTPLEGPSQMVSAEDPSRGLNSLSHDNELHPTSIVINVTTNIKPSSQSKENITQEQQQNLTTEEMEQKLQTIWEIAQGQSIEMLDYDSVQDLSLLLDSADNANILRRLGRSLGVPPQVIAHLQGFQDLFQYLRTSTYTLLPQLAQAAALLPNHEVVARIHRAVVNK
ncbi:tumor necrosis factor receptor superfamily member 27-like [Acanthochromis polyacanthus]|uniref:tumor necrosis factor receptor superfamily member 27-like n=1 Tax=Acanthochromis polyacanthus TaxID=80966 RepID=UPI00223484AA|nr:tumor necrosis factor receptor superfamily member 27-like [Acanthochromis polyacanthus]